MDSTTKQRTKATLSRFEPEICNLRLYVTRVQLSGYVYLTSNERSQFFITTTDSSHGSIYSMGNLPCADRPLPSQMRKSVVSAS